MLYYALNKELSGEKILKDIQNLINQHRPDKDSILTISISRVIKDNNEIILKLEHKQLESD